MDGETYTTSEAAKVLGYADKRRILQLLDAGDLEGYKDEQGRWRVYQHSVHAMLPERGPRGPRERPPEGPAEPSDLRDRVEALQRELGRLEGRLELTAVAESTLRESLDRERQRADAAELEAKRLRDELEKVRRSWWQKLFGGRES